MLGNLPTLTYMFFTAPLKKKKKNRVKILCFNLAVGVFFFLLFTRENGC